MLNAVSRPCQGSFKSRSGGRPEKCVSNSRTVICPLPFCANSGKICRHRIVEPDAALLEQLHDRGCGGNALGQRREIEDRVRRSWLARGFKRPRSRTPCDRPPLPLWPMSTTPPGMLPLATASCMIASMAAKSALPAPLPACARPPEPARKAHAPGNRPSPRWQEGKADLRQDRIIFKTFRISTFNRPANISFGFAQAPRGLGSCSCRVFNITSASRNAHAGLLQVSAQQPRPIHVRQLFKNRDAALQQLFVRQVHIDHQIAVNVAQADHGAGRQHVADELFRRSSLESRRARQAPPGRLRLQWQDRQLFPAAELRLQATATVAAPLPRAYSSALMVYGVNPLAAIPTTTSRLPGFLRRHIPASQFGGVLAGLGGLYQRALAAGNHKLHHLCADAESRRTLGCVQRANTPAGAAADVDQPAALANRCATRSTALAIYGSARRMARGTAASSWFMAVTISRRAHPVSRFSVARLRRSVINSRTCISIPLIRWVQ